MINHGVSPSPSLVAVYSLLCRKKVGRVQINKVERKNTMLVPEFRISKVTEEKFPRRHRAAWRLKNGKEKVLRNCVLNTR